MSDADEAQPVGDVLGAGFRIAPLPAGWTPLEGVVLVKCLDEDGHATWAFRTTYGLSDEEMLGALTVRQQLALRETVADYEGDDE